VVLNFDNAELTEVIRVLADTLRINILIDPRVKGTVSIHTVERISKDQVLPVLNQILKLNGFAIEKSGPLFKILPVEDAKREAANIVKPEESPPVSGDYSIKVYSLKYISRTSMSKIIQPFLSKGGSVAEVSRGNALVISDFADNLRRVEELVTLFDEIGFKSTKVRIFPVKNVDAEELAQELEGVLAGIGMVGDGSEAVAMLPIPRLSLLLAIASHDESLDQAERWIKELDRIPDGGIQTYVYSVENSKAVDLANVLNQIYGGGTVTAPTTRPSARAGTAGAPYRGPGASTTTRGGLMGGAGGSLGSGGGGGSEFRPQALSGGTLAQTGQPTGQPARPQPGTPAQPSPAPTPGAFAPQRPTPSGTVPRAPGAAPAEPGVKIVADEVTNSLIIQATPPDYRSIREILKKLDIGPRQVLIEVLVAEVSLKNDLKFGIEYEFGRRRNEFQIGPVRLDKDGNPIPGTARREFPLPGTLLDTLPSGFPSGLTATILDSNRVKAILNALAEQNRLRVLSSPHILSADNRQAYIRVGDEVPIITGQQQSTLTTQPDNPNAIINNIQYRNTGVILAVTPQVNSEGLVNMIVSQEVSDVKAEVGVGNSPVFFTRNAETTVVVQNGETLVIGGIIKDTAGQGKKGIPYLMDLPIIGRFFRLTTNTSDRVELVVLITPHVVRDRIEARKVTSAFLKKVQTIKERLKKEGLYPPLIDSTELPAPRTEEETPIGTQKGSDR
jgi:general secretion pathway protein D